jgi:hypothetical protein
MKIIIDTDKSGLHIVEGREYYYSKESVTLYYYDYVDGYGWQFCGLAQWEDSFDTEDSFVIELYDKDLAKEPIGDDLTLADAWKTAQEALGHFVYKGCDIVTEQNGIFIYQGDTSEGTFDTVDEAKKRIDDAGL